jgi:hypothetical protein
MTVSKEDYPWIKRFEIEPLREMRGDARRWRDAASDPDQELAAARSSVTAWGRMIQLLP